MITLNNPTKLNALTERLGEALTDRVKELKAESSVRVAVLTGAGRAFSAGGDLDWLMARHRDKYRKMRRARPCVLGATKTSIQLPAWLQQGL